MKLPFFPTHPAANHRERIQQLPKKHAEREKRAEISALWAGHERFLNCTVERKRSLGAKKFKFCKKMSSQDYQVEYFLYVVTVCPKLFKSFSN